LCGLATSTTIKLRVLVAGYAGYIVPNSMPGVTSSVIKHKMPLRPLQNCNIYFNNVLLKEANKLHKAIDFATGTNIILKNNGIYICWVATGIAMGSYDHAIKYTTSRKQFGQPIADKIHLIQGSNWFRRS
jgi:alkylation response protein AidB-like acyl-CoA dehydrogenase